MNYLYLDLYVFFPVFSFLYLYVLFCKLRFSKYRRDVE